MEETKQALEQQAEKIEQIERTLDDRVIQKIQEMKQLKIKRAQEEEELRRL